jgi:hypothetical protein
VLGAATVAFSGTAASQLCLRGTFEGQVNGSEVFRIALGNRLELRLDPLKDNWGWQAIISPQGSNDDWAYPVNPPLRFGNSQYMGTGYGETAREQLSRAHEIRFLLVREDYERISKLVNDALWPYSAKDPENAGSIYLNAIKRVRTGTVLITPVEYEKSGPSETVAWMKFKVLVIAPLDFVGNNALSWQKGSCDMKQQPDQDIQR